MVVLVKATKKSYALPTHVIACTREAPWAYIVNKTALFSTVGPILMTAVIVDLSL